MIFKINITVVIFHQISSATRGMQNEKGVHFFIAQKSWKTTLPPTLVPTKPPLRGYLATYACEGKGFFFDNNS